VVEYNSFYILELLSVVMADVDSGRGGEITGLYRPSLKDIRKAAALNDEILPGGRHLSSVWESYWRTKNGGDARGELAGHYLDYVDNLAKGVMGCMSDEKGVEINELKSCGTVGLMRSLDGYRVADAVKSGAVFTTYFYPAVRGEMKDHLRRQGFTSRLASERRAHVKDARAAVWGGGPDQPSDQQLLEELASDKYEDPNIRDPIRKARAIMRDGLSPVNMLGMPNEYCRADDGVPMTSLDELESRTSSSVLRLDDQEIMSLILTLVDDPEKELLALRFVCGLKMTKVGEKFLGYDRNRVHRLYSRLIGWIRAEIDDYDDGIFDEPAEQVSIPKWDRFGVA
jgi:RNA polymerase sigma factor (sigma-70 family)